MITTDPRTMDHLFAARQASIKEGYRASQRPSRLRIAAGIALIRLGERMRGYSMPSPERTPAIPAATLRPARTAS